MAGYLVSNAQPRGYALGFKDESRGKPTPEAISSPQFFPLFFILAERTYDEAITIMGNRDQVLGRSTFQKDSPYYTHANAFVKKLSAKANQLKVETIKLPGSQKAFLRLSVELIPTDIPQYERISDSNFGNVGEYKVDALGSRIKTGTIRGSKLVLRTGVDNYLDGQKAFGEAAIKTCRDPGSKVDDRLISSLTVEGLDAPVSAATTIYPIADIELTSYGKAGDLSGLRIFCPTTLDGNGPQLNDLKNNRAYSYRLMTVEKEDANSTPIPVELLTGDTGIDVSFKEAAVSYLSKNPISLARTLVPAYSQKATAARGAVYGPWGRVKVYDKSLETLLGILCNGYSMPAGGQMVEIQGEADFDTHPVIGQVREDWAMFTDPANIHLLNFLTGADHNGIPYGSLSVEDSVNLGGVTFDNGTAHFATGGASGLYYYADGRPAVEVNAKLFDDAVRARLRTFGQGINKYRDALKFPISTFIDSGWTLETKLEMVNILRQRPDMYVIAGTHAVYDEGQVADDDVRSIYRDGNVTDVENIASLVADWGVCPQQSEIEEDGYGAALKAAFNAVVESEYYSTPVTRAIIRGQSGRVVEEGIWEGFLPLTYEFMCQVSDLAGATSGIWRAEYDFTIEPNNLIKLMDEINNTYRENTSYSKLWDLGVNWVCSHDQFRYYTPAVQTVYPYDDSVLNSAKMMMACCRLEYLNLVVHSRMTGRDDLTDDEFIQMTKKIAEQEADGIFAGRYVVESHPEILESDKEKGFIWRNFYHIYGNVMKTAMIYGIIAKRMSDYTGSAN